MNNKKEYEFENFWKWFFRILGPISWIGIFIIGGWKLGICIVCAIWVNNNDLYKYILNNSGDNDEKYRKQ